MNIRKYRGKIKDTGEWVYGCLVVKEPPLQCFAEDKTEDRKYYIAKSRSADWNMPRPLEMIEVDPKTIGQSTGAKDKDGTEIYEGDILENDGEWYIVMWDDYSLQWEASGAIEDTESIALCEIVNESWIREEVPDEQ